MATATKKKTTKKTAPTVSDNLEGLTKPEEPIYIPTGNVGLDLAMTNGKGLPLGANIMFFGMPGAGKSTMICDTLKRLLDTYKKDNLPLRIHYVDAESSRKLLEDIGLWDYVYDKEDYAPQQLIYHDHIDSYTYLEELYVRMTTPGDNWSKDIYIVVIDSVTKLSTNSQLEKIVTAQDFGDNARTRKKLYGKWLSRIQKANITQIWVSQMSTKQNAQQFEDPKKPAVTEFDKHNMDIIIKLSPKKDTKLSDVKKVDVNTIQGKKTILNKYLVTIDPQQAQHTKNRYGQEIPIDVMIHLGKGIINAYVLRNILETFKHVSRPDTKNWSLTQELADFLGPEKLEQAGITDINKFERKAMNTLCSLFNNTILQFIKEREQYRVTVEEKIGDEDDGLFV